VLDHQPGTLTDAQTGTPRNLGRHAEARLHLAGHDRDVDEVRSRLANAQRVADEFAALLRHELRTPLTSIRGNLELLTDPATAAAPQAARLADAVARNSDRLLRLVDDLLLLAQLDTREPASLTLDLRAVVGDAVASARSRGNGAVETALPTRPVHTTGDPVLLTHAVEHLLTHAAAVAPDTDLHLTVAAEPPTIHLRGVRLPMLAADQHHLTDRDPAPTLTGEPSAPPSSAPSPPHTTAPSPRRPARPNPTPETPDEPTGPVPHRPPAATGASSPAQRRRRLHCDTQLPPWG
jgi:hypothetical protein